MTKCDKCIFGGYSTMLEEICTRHVNIAYNGYTVSIREPDKCDSFEDRDEYFKTIIENNG